MTKAAVSQFTSAKLEDAKSAKNSMINQQQNSDDITDSFDVSEIHQQASLNKASLSKFKSSVFYQYLDCSCINI